MPQSLKVKHEKNLKFLKIAAEPSLHAGFSLTYRANFSCNDCHLG